MEAVMAVHLWTRFKTPEELQKIVESILVSNLKDSYQSWTHWAYKSDAVVLSGNFIIM